MQKTYIPPRERKGFRIGKIKLTPFGFVVCFALCFSMVSLASVIQSLFIPNASARVSSEQEEIIQAEISDSIKFSKATAAEIQQVRFADLPRTISNLPVERAWPVRGRITTYYSSYHPAIDIANHLGTPVHPFASGVVTVATRGGSWGNYVVIRHNDGFETAYAHLNQINVVPAQEVNLTTVIGTVGSTGRSTGPHLHFQVSQNGYTINPFRVLP